MAISPAGGKSKDVERPAACRSCGAAAWWNGTRRVSVVRKVGEQVEYVVEVVRRRVRCSLWKSCALRSWTLYEQDSYPHRLFGLTVVSSAVSAVVFGKATHAAAAAAHRCSRRTVGRWKRWVGELGDVEQLQRACSRLQPDGLPGALGVSGASRAARVLHLLDRLVELLVARGVQLPELACPVARLLQHQLAGFGEVFYLTKASPPLRADLGSIRL
mgnify:CR=1 FL=1